LSFFALRDVAFALAFFFDAFDAFDAMASPQLARCNVRACAAVLFLLGRIALARQALPDKPAMLALAPWVGLRMLSA
jgi:hypothetical protein